MTTSLDVRDRLVDALRIDLVGPGPGHALHDERIPSWVRPSNWYLTSFLIPSGTPPDKSADADEDDDFQHVPESAGLAEESNEERKAAKKGYFPERLDMFFLATVDAEGQPTCSYKGGDPGFVTVVDEQTLAFPNYDGNGVSLHGQRGRDASRGPSLPRLRAPATHAGRRNGGDSA